jgi:hypothetical protein
MRKLVEMEFEFNNTIPKPPAGARDMYKQACANDAITVDHWRDKWIANIQANHKRYGSFGEHGIGKLFGIFDKKPVIVAGAGPSLKNSIEGLKDSGGIPIISCLHNFHFMVDNGIPVDYYVTLDAGEVTVEEISEGGSKTHEEYLKATEGKTLLAFIGTHPKLLESWKGKILFFNCPMPDESIMKEVDAIEVFHTYVSTGGNVLGACAYIARAITGCMPLVFVGADFCFSYIKKFHAWDSKYDANVGDAIRAIDVFGNRVLTWQSYYNFKIFFDWLVCTVPGIYINCTEGGLLGAYPEGNIAQIQQMELKSLIRMYRLYEEIKTQCLDPTTSERKLLY